MSMDNAVSFEELERRRKMAMARRKSSQPAQSHHETDSEAMAVINEIFNPSLKLPETTGPYKLPDEMSADDVQDLDIRKMAELKEVFLLFDIDSDGRITKNDLRITYMALGADVSEEFLDEMLKEAKDPLDFDAFVDLMSHRTCELDPEDVLLEAWSKWDDYGTGKIDERNCVDYVEVFPYLREPVIENSTNPDYVICNRTTTTKGNGNASGSANGNGNVSANGNSTAPGAAAVGKGNSSSPLAATIGSDSNASGDLRKDAFIYSAGRVVGMRVRFKKPLEEKKALNDWILNITGEYRFLKKDNFRNDGRLIVGTYCDYYFFADANATPKALEIWKYFHSPRFPAHYPAHIKCAYKFIGRPESRVEIVFEELQIPKQEPGSCSMDKLTIFDSESANMNAVIDVVCNALPTRRIVSSGPDLLIEFNASSNVTAKGFRGKFKFMRNEIEASPTDTALAMEKLAFKKQTLLQLGKFYQSNENCKMIFDTRVNKTGTFETSELFAGTAVVVPNVNTIQGGSYFPGRVQCRYEFYGEADERVQIKFLDFNIPTESKNSTECKSTESLQLLTQVRGKYEAAELYCGAFIPNPIMSFGPKLLLQFVGKYPAIGSKVSYYGFKAEYRFLRNFGITTGQQVDNNCTFVYNSTERKSGWFGTPNFPGFYPQNILCNYFFYAESEERVAIRFTYFDVEGIGTCEYLTASDHVEFSNFMTTDRKFAKYCGKRDKFEIYSDSRFFRITFYSNDRFDKTGFRALYDFESKHTPSENTSVQSYMSRNVAVELCNAWQWSVLIYLCLNLQLIILQNFMHASRD